MHACLQSRCSGDGGKRFNSLHYIVSFKLTWTVEQDTNSGNERKKRRKGKKEEKERRGREGKGEGRQRKKAGGKGSTSQLPTLHLINMCKGPWEGERERRGPVRVGEGGRNELVYVNHSFWLETALICISLSNYLEYDGCWRTSLVTKPLPPSLLYFFILHWRWLSFFGWHPFFEGMLQ